MLYRNRLTKKISLIVLSGIIICLVGCSSDITGGTEFEVVFGLGRSYSDYGMCYKSGESAHLCDAATGEDVVICSQPDCRHGNRKECDGNIGPMSTDLFLTEKYELFIKKPAMEGDRSKGFNDVELWRADLDGRNRKLLTSLENTQLTISADYSDGLFVYCYREQNEDKVSDGGVTFDKLEKTKAGVIIIDIETGEAKLIDSLEGYNATFCSAVILDKKLYYVTAVEDAVRDFEPGPELDWNKEAAFREEHSHQSIFCYNIDSGEKKQVWSDSAEYRELVVWGEGYIIYPSDECGMYSVVVDGEIIEIANQEFNSIMKSGKLTGIYIYENRIYLVCNEAIYVYDLRENKMDSLMEESVIHPGLIRIDAITNNKVYLWLREQEDFCAYCVDKNAFMDGDLTGAVKLH